jgi:hypothetical protein
MEYKTGHTVAQFAQLNVKATEWREVLPDPLGDEDWNPVVVRTPPNYRVGLGMPTRLTMITSDKKREYIIEVRVRKLR